MSVLIIKWKIKEQEKLLSTLKLNMLITATDSIIRMKKTFVNRVINIKKL